MPRTKQRKTTRRRGRRSDPSGMPIVPTTAISYNGPVVPFKAREMLDIRCEILRLDTDIIANGSGVVANVIGSNPSGYSNWTQFSSTYDEYRVLALTVHYEPYNKYKATPNSSPLYVVGDRADASALTSYANALEYSSVMTVNSAQSWTKSIKMNGSEEAVFTPIGTGVSTLYIKLYAGILSTSTAIGRTSSAVLVQFRGTK